MSKPAEDLLAKLVAFDTVSHKSNRACIDFIRDYLDGFGIGTDILLSDDGAKACLWATIGNPQKRGVAIAGHTDVVPVDGQHWTSDPFTLTAREERLFGRGTADMKGFIACALAFVPEFLAAETGGCFHLALTSDEETDMSGARRLTDFLAAQNIAPTCLWVGEPTRLTIVDQHKGVSSFLTNLQGVPCHSGQSSKGVNAIDLTRRLMNLIDEVAQERRARPFAESRFDLPYSTVNFGTIQGGSAENIVAEHCALLWEVRPHPGDTAHSFFEEVERRAQTAFACVAPRAKMETALCCETPPFLAAPTNRAVTALRHLLQCEETQAVGFATEAGFYQKITPDVVICGPGSINQAHQPDEFIDKTQLSACVDLMRRFLLSSLAHDKSAPNRSMP